MNVTVSTSRPGILVHAVALTAAVLGAFWAWSGMNTPDLNQGRMSSTDRLSAAPDTLAAPVLRSWTTGDIGKMVVMSGLSIEALSMSSDEEQVVVRALGNYDDLYTLTGKLRQAAGLCVNSLSLKKSRRVSLIEATIVLSTMGRNDQ